MNKMVFSDFKVRGEGNEMEVIALGDASGRKNSCPELNRCNYANRGEGLTDKERFERCGPCFWDYENCEYYKKTIN